MVSIQYFAMGTYLTSNSVLPILFFASSIYFAAHRGHDWAILEKIQTYFGITPGISRFVTLKPWKLFEIKQSFTPAANTAELSYYTSLEIPGPNHQDPWKFHCNYFLIGPWNFHMPCCFFLLNQ